MGGTGLFSRFSAAAGAAIDSDAVFEVLFWEASAGEADAGGLLAFNLLAGEPIGRNDREFKCRERADPRR
jgi:hypothetical protein